MRRHVPSAAPVSHHGNAAQCIVGTARAVIQHKSHLHISSTQGDETECVIPKVSSPQSKSRENVRILIAANRVLAAKPLTAPKRSPLFQIVLVMKVANHGARPNTSVAFVLFCLMGIVAQTYSIETPVYSSKNIYRSLPLTNFSSFPLNMADSLHSQQRFDPIADPAYSSFSANKSWSDTTKHFASDNTRGRRQNYGGTQKKDDYKRSHREGLYRLRINGRRTRRRDYLWLHNNRTYQPRKTRGAWYDPTFERSARKDSNSSDMNRNMWEDHSIEFHSERKPDISSTNEVIQITPSYFLSTIENIGNESNVRHSKEKLGFKSTTLRARSDHTVLTVLPTESSGNSLRHTNRFEPYHFSVYHTSSREKDPLMPLRGHRSNGLADRNMRLSWSDSHKWRISRPAKYLRPQTELRRSNYFEKDNYVGWLEGSLDENKKMRASPSIEAILGKNIDRKYGHRRSSSDDKVPRFKFPRVDYLYERPKETTSKKELSLATSKNLTHPRSMGGRFLPVPMLADDSSSLAAADQFKASSGSEMQGNAGKFTRPLPPSENKKQSAATTRLWGQADSRKKARQKRKIELASVRVVAGKTATLPCSLDTREPEDSVQIVLWIKEGIHTPLYSYDYRELMEGRPKQTKPDTNSTLAQRTSFRTDAQPAALVVERVRSSDSGVYRCRVDFLMSPTRNSRVNLTVVVPPSRARVTWRQANTERSKDPAGLPAQEGVIGPFRVGDRPVLLCTNDDAFPPPSVVWYEGDKVLDDSFEVSGGVGEDSLSEDSGSLPAEGFWSVSNELTLPMLTRDDLARRLTCTASNNNNTQPATKTVVLSMILGIVAVRVETISAGGGAGGVGSGGLVAGQAAEVACNVWGSRPPPAIVWWMGAQKLSSTSKKVTEGGNLTVAVLQFTPRPEDDGAMMVCQAENSALGQQPLQDSKLLSVNYVPLVRVRLGRSLDPDRIKEGDDVYFECSVQAKPPIHGVVWKHNDNELADGKGVFASNMSLVVQGVTRNSGGNYTCHATNSLGAGASPPLHLDVKYAPVCATEQGRQHSVGKLENAEISCQVHANPANVSFRWTFNNTAEAIDVPRGRFGVSGTESRVNYTPMTELDYGTLLCWANNSIGTQESPCVFQIVAAGKPDPPHNCRVFDVTISSLQAACLPGDNGGMEQSFLLQVFQIGSTSPVLEVSRPSPSFSVTNLRPATAYKVVVAAINKKGYSRAVELKAYTIRLPETQEETSAEPTRDRDRVSPVPIAVLIGSGVTIVLLTVVVIVFVRVRACRRRSAQAKAGTHRRNGGGSEECDVRPASSSSSAGLEGICLGNSLDSSSGDDKNPDILCDTPDPTDSRDRLLGDISTISTTTSGFYLGNGGSAAHMSHLAAHNTASCMDYMQLSRAARTGSPNMGSVYKTGSDCGSPIQSSMNPNNHSGGGALSSAGHEQILDVPLPPPASYNQGYTPDDHCLKQSQNIYHSSDGRSIRACKDNSVASRRQITFADQRRNPEVLPHILQSQQLQRVDSFKQQTNQQFQGVDNSSNKNMKPLDVRTSCPAPLSCTLPRQSLPYHMDPLRGCQALPHGRCEPSEHHPSRAGLGLGASRQSHALPEGDGDVSSLQYGTLGRVKPRGVEMPSKIRRELRASASDLTDRKKNFSCDKNKQESAV